MSNGSLPTRAWQKSSKKQYLDGVRRAAEGRARQKSPTRGKLPSPAVRPRAVRRPRLASLIVPDLVHPFFAELAKGLAEALRASHSLVIASTEEEVDVEREQIDELLARDVDALFI